MLVCLTVWWSVWKQSWGRKRLWLPPEALLNSWKGIDWTDNGDGTISASGTATETSAFYFVSTGERKMLANIGDTLTISGGHSSNARIMVRCLDSNGTQLSAINAMGESASGVIPENTAYMDAYIRIASGTKVENLTFRPMFELGNVAHDFVPYHFGGAKDASTLERHTAKEIGESGARNLIPYPYQETTHTDNGISWVDNGDGTITASGTATADSYYYLPVGGQFYLNAGTYSISGCPSGGSSTKYRVQLSNNAWTISATDYGNGGTITTTERVNFAQLRLTISKGVTVNNLVFKPMLVLGSVPMPYSPYYVGGAEDSLKLGGLLPSEFVGALPHTKARLSSTFTVQDLLNLRTATFFTNWDDNTNFPFKFATGVVIPSADTSVSTILYAQANVNFATQKFVIGHAKKTDGVWSVTWTNGNDGGNADTVDGKHADDFIQKNGGGEVQKTGDIPFAVKNTTANSNTCLIAFTSGDGATLAMGLSGGKAVISGQGEMFHQGNSTGIKFTEDSTTAPSVDMLWAHL